MSQAKPPSLEDFFAPFIAADKADAAFHGGKVAGLLFALRQLGDAPLGWRVLVEEHAVHQARNAHHFAAMALRREEALREHARRMREMSTLSLIPMPWVDAVGDVRKARLEESERLLGEMGHGSREEEKAQEHLDMLRLGDTHSSDVDPGDFR